MKASEKIVPLRILVARLAPMRAAGGGRIALANGVFDLLHVGHVRYLEAAKGLADVLVVGVNSDRSARMSKGPGHPVIPERERAEIVAALSSTDYVVLFDEPDVRALIVSLRPDVHAKGTDYTPLTVPERAEVESYGGRVEIAGDPKDHSSSQLVEKIRSSSVS